MKLHQRRECDVVQTPCACWEEFHSKVSEGVRDVSFFIIPLEKTQTKFPIFWLLFVLYFQRKCGKPLRCSSSYGSCGSLEYLDVKTPCHSYQYNPKYWDRKAFANSVDPDRTPRFAASDQGLHCFPYIQQYFGIRMEHFKF